MKILLLPGPIPDNLYTVATWLTMNIFAILISSLRCWTFQRSDILYRNGKNYS
jgi:hypothetical protein